VTTSSTPRHVLTASQFDRETLDALFDKARELKKRRGRERGLPRYLHTHELVLLFFEPSTRTRLSFELAAKRLKARVVFSENAGAFSSAAKGESIEDTVRVLEAYGVSGIVIRHDTIGAPAAAARVANIPVINAGDGAGEHPTQALLDLYTILDLTRTQEETTVALCGDLKNGRTVRSLCRLVIRYYETRPCPIRFLFVSPAELRMGEDVRAELDQAQISYTEQDDLDRALRAADIVYQTRVQKERFSASELALISFDEIRERFRLDPHRTALMKPDAAILHPLPRVGEIDPSIDTDPRARYFEQAGNGLYVRMALLLWALLPGHVS